MNINRDYLIINDVKKSNITLDNGSILFYITDKNTQNIFVNLVINISNNDLIQKYANIENAEDYTLTMNIVKPDNTYEIIQGKLHDKANAIFEFDLPDYCCDKVGSYRCELLTKCHINNREEITTSNKITYKVKSSVLNDLDEITEAPEYPLVIQLFDKLSDIEQYEEDRRANELARQLAEEQRQTRFNALDADMVDRVNAMDSKMDDIEARISAKEQAVDKLIVDTKVDIDDYKVAKDTEIDEYKTAKDQQIDQVITNQNNKIDDAIANQNNKIDTAVAEQNNRIEIVEASDNTQNTRLDALEAKDIAHETSITNIEAKNVEQDNRLDSIEAVNVSQDNRLDAIEIKNQQQDDRLLDVEKVNKRQDMDLKCLFAESKNNMIDVTEEGNSIYLQNSTVGYTLIDEIRGNTLVNCNKEPDKEIILNGNINTQGYSNVTLTEGVDGGLVDVALEGNTMVNVCDQKDPVAITKSYTVETGNHVALQGEYDGKCRPVVTGNTLWIDNNTGEVLTAFDDTKNLRLQSSFEDKVVTQEMVDSGEELAENLGKYKVDYVISREDGTVGQTKTFYLNSPLLEGDTIEQQGDNVVHVHRYGKVVLDGSENWKITGISRLAYLNISDKIQGSNTIICDTLKSTIIAGDSNNTNLGIYMFPNDSGSQIRIRLTTSDTADSVRQYLQQNPITVAYKLATPTYEVISQNDTILCDSYVNGHLDVDSVVPIDKVDFLHFEEGLTYLYTNTQYTVQFVSNAVSKVNITLGGAKLLNQNVIVGTNKYMITTPSELVDNNLVLNGEGFNASNIVVTEATDQEFGYFEGMKSVGECEDLEVVSSNSDGTLSNTQTLTHEPLRAVGDIKDKYVLIDGKWYIERNCGEVVLDGSEDEDWKYMNTYGSASRFDIVNISDLKVNSRLNVKCDNFPNIVIGTKNIEGISVHGSNKQLQIQTAKVDTNVNNFKSWLQANPVTVVYQLASPTYEPINYNPFTVYSDITHISNNSTIPCNMTIKNTGYNCLLKPNTTYTVSSNLGLNTVTTPSTLTEDCLRFYDTDTSTVTTMKDVMVLEGDYTTGKPLPAHFSGIESAFEQEYDEAVGKHKVKIRVQNEDASKENYIEFYINEPLRGVGDVKDKVYVKDDKVVVERKCGVRAYQDGDFGTYLTDKVNTVYPLAEPVYEEVEYNDVKLFIESFKNSTLLYNSNVPVTSKLYYSYSVPLVDTVAQTADISDQQDSMIIDLATQVSVMEMMLM